MVEKGSLEITPIESITLNQAVYKQLVNLIMSGKIVPGERLTLEHLARQLHVSIMPVREAIRKLEADRFVSVQQNRRITVNQLSSENLQEIYEIRLTLEGIAAKRACRNFTDQKVNDLNLIHTKLINQQSSNSVMEINREFHFYIYEQSEMPILMELIRILWNKISPYFYIFFNGLMPDSELWSSEKIFEYHRQMIEALRTRDQREVVKWLEKDMTEGMRYLKL